MTESNGNVSNGNGAKANGHSEIPHRGTIIVDTSTLFGLSVDVAHDNVALGNSKNGGKSINQYVELLPFLAKNGYNVVFTEMTSYEAGQLLKSGADVKDIFDGKILYPERRTILMPLLKDAILRKGNEEYKHKEHPNINTVSNTGPYYVDNFCRVLDEVTKERHMQLEEANRLANYRSKSGVDKIIKSIFDLAKSKASKVINVKIERKEKQKIEYGDEAIISLIGKKYKTPDEPVFVFADDKGLRRRINKEYPHVSTVTTSGFIYSLARSGLGTEVGLPESVSADILERERRKSILVYDKTKKNHSNPVFSIEYTNAIDSSPFTQSLKQLAEDLEKAKAANGVAVENGGSSELDGNSQLAKYYKRYGNKANQTVNSPSR